MKLHNERRFILALNNLKGELVKAGVKQYEVAEFLEMSNGNFNKKLAESVPFMSDEMYALRDKFLPNLSIDYLFTSDGDKPATPEPERDCLADERKTVRA